MKILLIALLSISVSVGSTEAATINLIATKDNTLIENVEGSFSNGAGEFLFVGKTDDSELRRAVLHFDIADAIPAGSTINSVILHLSVTRAANNKPASENVELHKLLASWGEGSSNSAGGGGAASTTDDATWIHRFYPSELWTNAGGDFSATVSASTLVDDIGSYTWGSNSKMVADVQEWLDTPSDNFGWLLLGDESFNRSTRQFASKENSNEALRPVLTVDYTPSLAIVPTVELPLLLSE
jgi:hypothetical protein